MTLLAPIWLIVGIAAAAGVLVLHFIARQRPAPMTLPTTRFVPDLPARAASRARRPTDLLLLLLRALALVLLGLAFAGPILRPERAAVVRIVMLDRSAAVAQPDSAAAIARTFLREGDVLVSFDTVATAVAWAERAEIPMAREAPADVAAALLFAIREARALSARADSIEVVLVSPLDASGWSAAVLPIRREWPGAIRVEQVPGTGPELPGSRIALRSEADDPLAATVALLGEPVEGAGTSRLVRTAPTATDSAWARSGGGPLVYWPRDVRPAEDSVPAPQGFGAVIARDVVAIAPWSRGAEPEGRVIAWWADGVAAAAESPLGAGCVREVEIGVPTAGDVALRMTTQRLVRALTAPCGVPMRLGPVADTLVRQLAGDGPMVSGTRLVRAGVPLSGATPWLLAAGLVLLLIEWRVRRLTGRT